MNSHSKDILLVLGMRPLRTREGIVPLFPVLILMTDKKISI